MDEGPVEHFFAFNLVCYIFLCFICYRLLAVGYGNWFGCRLLYLSVVFVCCCLPGVVCIVYVECRLTGVAVSCC